jgi:RimJ/RimL family protein N-acetyltransferase
MRAGEGAPALDRLTWPIETSRLLLRPPRRSDVPALVPLVGDWRVARPTRIPHPYSVRDGYEFVRSNDRKRKEGSGVALSIFDKETERLLGGTGIHAINWVDRRFELGYWIGPSDWGKGIATEAAYAVCREAFHTLGFHRAHACVFAFNPRSARVLRKIGFRLEGRFRQQHRDGRTWVDELQFGLLPKELKAPPKSTQTF